MKTRIPLLLLAPLLLASQCDWAGFEEVRRRREGNSQTPAAAAAVEARIAAVEVNLRTDAFTNETHTLADRMAERNHAGLVIAVISEGRVEWVKGYGAAHATQGGELHAYTRFQAASLSKPTTAIAAMTLVDDGLLDLDEDVNAKLTSWQVPENVFTQQQKATTRGIVTHTAGFNVPSFFGYTGAVPTLLQVLDGLPPALEPAIRVVYTPGTFYAYSGGGFTVLQQLIQDVTGKPFAEALAERVLAPLGMDRSGFDQPLPAGEPFAANPHIFGTPQGPVVYPQLAAAGLWTTPLDVARLVIGLQAAYAGTSTAVLSQASAQEILTLQVPAARIGLGFWVDRFSAPNYFWHTGQNLGFESIVVGRIEGGVGAVVMVNDMLGNVDETYHEIVNAIAHVYDWPDWFGL